MAGCHYLSHQGCFPAVMTAFQQELRLDDTPEDYVEFFESFISRSDRRWPA